MELNAFAKSVESCQPAQSAQADMSRNFPLSLIFLPAKGPFYIMTNSLIKKVYYESITR